MMGNTSQEESSSKEKEREMKACRNGKIPKRNGEKRKGEREMEGKEEAKERERGRRTEK